MHRAMKKLRGGFFAVGVFSFFINMLMLTAPIYMLQIYDRVLGSRSPMTLLMLTIVAGGLLVASGILDAIRSRLLVRLGVMFDSEISAHVFTAYLRSRFFRDTSDQPAPVRDVETVRAFLSSPGLTLFFDAPWIPFFIILVFYMHPLLGVVSVGGALILILLPAIGELLTRRANARVRNNTKRANQVIETSLRNVEAIEAMGFRNNLLQGWLKAHFDALRDQMAAGDTTGLMTALSKSFRQILQTLLLASGAYLAIQEIITPGVMIAASIIVGRALAPVESAIGSWRMMSAARVAYRRLEALLNENPMPMSMPLPRPEGRLVVESVVATVPRSPHPILRGVSFEIDPGDVLGIVGRTASGKTTLARLLVGIWEPSIGNVRLDGSDIYHWDHDDLGQYIGYLPESVELINGTVAENIARFADPDPEKVIRAAQVTEVHEMIQRLPEGYDTMIGEGGSRLSGGQRQRIALARAVYGDPSLVVLDEPNSNTDFAGDQSLLSTIESLKSMGTTVVIVSHRPTIIACVDKLLILNGGRVEKFGPRGEVVPSIAPTRNPAIGKQHQVA